MFTYFLAFLFASRCLAYNSDDNFAFAITHYFRDEGCVEGTQYMTLSMPLSQGKACNAYNCKGPNAYEEYTQHYCQDEAAETYGVVMTEYDNAQCDGDFDLQFSVKQGTCTPSDDASYQTFSCNSGESAVEGAAECEKGCSNCAKAIDLDQGCFLANDGETYLSYSCSDYVSASKKGISQSTIIYICAGAGGLLVLASAAFCFMRNKNKETTPHYRPQSGRGNADPLLANLVN
eukprot:gb/GEZN01010390.1/.p1 GENE.gb/GEZN01010390.1/~~gb/GEZN01010390.1/.p1  ORF type:complete len:243 (-),score=22.28 gb/GEZN01010390.1/:515-1213(-)